MSDYRLTQGEVDNGIFEVLRKAIVAAGYLADVALYDVSTDAGLTAFNTANDAIVTGGKQLINIFSVGMYSSRGLLQTNNIVIDRAMPKPASTGTGIAYDYDPVPGQDRFSKTKLADTKFDISYTVTYFTMSTTYADIIEDIIRRALGIRKLITGIKEDTTESNKFWLWYKTEQDLSGADDIERMVMYDAKNVDLIGSSSEGTVSQFKEFIFEVNLPPNNLTDTDNSPTVETDTVFVPPS